MSHRRVHRLSSGHEAWYSPRRPVIRWVARGTRRRPLHPGSMRSRGAVKRKRVVRLRAVRVEGQVRQPWEEQCTRPAEVMLDRRGELAAEEDRAAGLDFHQHISAFGQIDRLDEPSVESAGLLNMGVEIGQALNLDQASSHGIASWLPMMFGFCQGLGGTAGDPAFRCDHGVDDCPRRRVGRLAVGG